MEGGYRIQSHIFFRSKLLSLTGAEELAQHLGDMQRDQKDMRKLMIRIMWHMRGSLSRQEAWSLSPDERQDIVTLIEEHRELTEKTGLALL